MSRYGYYKEGEFYVRRRYINLNISLVSGIIRYRQLGLSYTFAKYYYCCSKKQKDRSYDTALGATMDKEMVQALGINVKAIYFLYVFLLGAGMAALRWLLISTMPQAGVIFAEMGMQYAICSFHSSNHWRARKRTRFSHRFFNCRISWCFLQRILYRIYHLQSIC